MPVAEKARARGTDNICPRADIFPGMIAIFQAREHKNLTWTLVKAIQPTNFQCKSGHTESNRVADCAINN
jgi:hypothetical protein